MLVRNQRVLMANGINKKKYLVGIFQDEDMILNAVRSVCKAGIPVFDVFSPYAVHGLDDAMGIKRSKLPIVTFLAGLTGGLLAMLLQLWVFNIDWPIIVGGKPFNAVPAFVPIAFELTVLVGGLVTVAAFLFRSRLGPGATPKLFDSEVTNKNFVLAIEQKDASLDINQVKEMLIGLGAVDVKEKEV